MGITLFPTAQELVSHIRREHEELRTPNGGVSVPLLRFDYHPFEDDVLIMGRGGTGKTTLLDRLILQNAAYPVWLFDFRRQYTHLSRFGYKVAHFPDELMYGRLVFQPSSSDTAFEDFCARADRCSNLVIAVEEAHMHAGKYSFHSKSFEKIVKEGRPQGRSWICITRRPQDLHNSILSDADHIFCFALELPSDILYVQKWIGPEVQLHLNPEYRTIPQLRSQPQLPEHSFVYKSVNEGTTDLGRL